MAMDSNRKVALISACIFSGFASAHLIDEFVWGAPKEFHLSVEFTQILALAFMLSLVGLVVSAALGSSSAFTGLALTGFLIALADILKHLFEILQSGPWRSGFVSEFLALGLIVSGVVMFTASCRAWRADLEKKR
jgi:hypothetical protein